MTDAEIIAELRAEIILMRCCGNCKHQHSQANVLPCSDCNGKNNWEWQYDRA